MQKLIDLAAWASGVGPKLWAAIDGSKTYIAAGTSILTGALGLLQEAAPILASHDTGALYAFVKALPHDQSWMMIVGAAGLGAMRHAIAKQTDPAPAAAAPTPAAQ